MRTKLVAMLFVSVCLFAGAAWANNTTAPTAYSILPNSTASDTFFNASDQERWYMFDTVAGRSYCAETQGGVFFDTSASDLDTILYVYRGDHVTQVATNDDAGEPYSVYLSRACFVAPYTERTYVKAIPWLAGDAFYFRVAVYETTLYSNWFFLGGDYNAFTLIRNTTNASLSYTINWRNSSGTIVATVSASLPANGSYTYNARSYAAAVSAGSGTVEIAHNGSADAMFATTTVLSATTGLGFDTFFSRRH